MDLGIAGKRAIVCAGSRGLGRACARHLLFDGVEVVVNGRREDVLSRTVEELKSETGGNITGIAGDVTTDEGRAALLDACPEPDILVNNAGGPPPGDFRDWDRGDWIKAVNSNMLTPIELIKATVDGMISRKFGRIVNITSGAVKAPIPTLGLSNGARAGLTGFVAGIARQTVAHNVTINNLLPGPFDTDRLEGTLAAFAKARGIDVDQAREVRRNENPAKRYGDPEEFGAACAFLCSQWAGYITGQNLLLDGGAFPGTL
ncbi:MAG: SDR family oxidoreductase [Geminicoccaceae bacterium]